MDIHLILAAISLWAIGGIPSLVYPQHSEGGRRMAALLALAGSAAGLLGAGRALALGTESSLHLAWPVPGGAFSAALDPLSAAFLIPIFSIPVLACVYGLGYWPQAERGAGGSRLQFFFSLMVASMALLVVARNGILFLAAWEAMALAGFFTLTAGSNDAKTQEAGWIYLVATHVGTLFLIGLFGWYGALKGSLEIERLAPGSISSTAASGLFLLGLVGFGLKAGIMPLHVWLPSAHANAPSHVSAVFSGVLIKVGIYGIMRVCWILPDPPVWWGGTLLVFGVASGVFGMAFALAQRDLKRLLAYSSIENIGIILIGLGLAMVGQARGQWEWMALGLAGAMFHTWNHALFKSLLFLSAGSAIHGSGTREIDRMGGIARRMPWTAWGFLVGAVAVCGLPPLNGFIGELFIYLGLFRSAGSRASGVWSAAVFAVPFLALIGGLALLCFVKAYGAVFLGEARRPALSPAHECGGWMRTPMVLLGAACLLIGLAPWLVSPLLDELVANWLRGANATAPSLVDLAPLRWAAPMGAALLVAIALGYAFLRSRAPKPGSVPTWDCGYIRPAPSMQYTSSSFGQTMAGLFSWALRPSRATVKLEGVFPAPSSFESRVADTILERGMLPVFRAIGGLLARLHFLQSGWIQAYMLYILIALLFAMLMA